jgi:ATP-dependent RNA helicase TDRD9
MDKTANEDTRLLYVTTGVLLRKLIKTKNMLQFTHVILDEVNVLSEKFQRMFFLNSLKLKY